MTTVLGSSCPSSEPDFKYFFSLWNYWTLMTQTSDNLNTFLQSCRVRPTDVLLYGHFLTSNWRLQFLKLILFGTLTYFFSLIQGIQNLSWEVWFKFCFFIFRKVPKFPGELLTSKQLTIMIRYVQVQSTLY